MTDQEKKIIVEWMGGCWHEIADWVEDYWKPDEPYGLDISGCICGFDHAHTCVMEHIRKERSKFTFDGNFRDAVRDKLIEKGLLDESFRKFFYDQNTGRCGHTDWYWKLFTDNNLFFTTLANFIKERKER